MTTALMVATLTIGLLMISACLAYDSKGNTSVDSEVKETGKNAFISKSIVILAFLFFVLCVAQLIIK